MKKFLYILLTFWSFSLYFILNRDPQNLLKAKVIKFWLDDYIPLIPIFIIPYIIYIPFLLTTFFYFTFFTKKYINICISLIFSQTVAALFYKFYQTTIYRPEIISTDIFSSMVIFTYSHDQPYNCFPSLHVSLSLISGFYWIQQFPHVKKTMIILVTIISLSTILVKQHYLPDVIGGIILALISFYIGEFISSLLKN